MDVPTLMAKIRAIIKESGLTQQEVGVRMGYPEKSARQSVSQFLKSRNPTFVMVTRFAEAMEVGMGDLQK